MKLGLAQINPTIGDFTANTEKIIDYIRRARAQAVDLLVFPELSLCGYPPRDFLDFPEFADRNLLALERVSAETDGITVACGVVERNPLPTGRPLFNAAVVLRDQKRVAICHKRLLPYYDVFDESRHFESGSGNCAFMVAGKRVGITICEDAWNASQTIRPYPIDPLRELSGVDLILNLSASPFSLGRPQERLELFAKAARAAKATIAFCNQVGGNDELIFDGCSFLLDASGSATMLAAAFREELVIQDSTSPAWPRQEGAWLAGALEMGLGDYVRKCHGSRVCLGLSGGIDSSVVAVIAAKELGPENVVGVSLPTHYTSSASQEDAEALARNLGITFHTLPIEPLLQGVRSTWKSHFRRELEGVALENVQPRLRMTLLMSLANEQNLMLLNTSNKSEVATGYATLYGDSAGALSVLGDLTKAQVYRLGRHYNASAEVIPERVFTRAPTAELRENQVDQDSLPPYDILDAMVERRLHGVATKERLLAEGFAEVHVDRFLKLHAASEYKRRQLPPALRVSRKAFGMGRRMPIAAVPPL